MFRLSCLCLVLVALPGLVAAKDRPPNVVVLFADDQGYADLGCSGATDIDTPNIDRLAKEGMRFTDFYVAQPVCSSSRVALLTGCYPNRLGITGALNPSSKIGIADSEELISEVLKKKGYAAAVYGKWHLGHHPRFLPTRHGFDDYFGLPYSNDMWPKHPTSRFPDLPLVEGEKVIQHNPDQSKLTTWYTERAVAFIEKHKDQPFFLYVPYAMPHVPLFVSEKFKGKSKRGLYGDVIMEIDWSVGRVLDALKRTGNDERTLVVYTSDNGPWLSYGNHAGRAGPLREGKGTCFEGGVRVPFLARWPGTVPAGAVCREPAMTIDLLPTVARFAGAPLPANRIDGKDIGPLLRGEKGARSPQEAYSFYWLTELHAVRAGDWKLHLPHRYPHPTPGADGKPGKTESREIGQALFNLKDDPGEKDDVAAKHPEVVERLLKLAEKSREDLGDKLTGKKGTGLRQPGRVE